MRIRREIKKYIETELQDYDRTKKEWEQLQSELTNRNNVETFDTMFERLGIDETVQCQSVTESKALRLITNKRLSQLERTIKAIEKVMMNLPEEKFKLVQMKYWDVPRTLTDDGIAYQLSCDRRTIYKWTDGIILAIAIEMGLIDEIGQKEGTF